MKKWMKHIKNCIFVILSITIAAYIAVSHFYPEQIAIFLGYRGYVILTDSMEPTIPTYSVVLVKMLKDGEEPEKNAIISFRANRLGDDIILTHYFRENELDENGIKLYRTEAEGIDHYDDYETYREDLIGTYVAHVPYIGKFIAFLKSPFALIELGIIGLITVIYNILWMKFDKEEKAENTLKESNDTEQLHEFESKQAEVNHEEDIKVSGETDEQ